LAAIPDGERPPPTNRKTASRHRGGDVVPRTGPLGNGPAVLGSTYASFAASKVRAYRCRAPHTGRISVAVALSARILATTNSARLNGG